MQKAAPRLRRHPTRNAVRQFRRAYAKRAPDEKQDLQSLAKYLHIPAPVTKKILTHELNLRRQTHPQAPSK